jgi:hypothetical protein
METNERFSDSLKKELDAISNDTILHPAYRKKKLILWIIRTTISVILYIIFWKHEWVKWSLILTVPLSLFSLFTIVGSAYFLKRKIERTRKKIEEVDKIINETPGI